MAAIIVGGCGNAGHYLQFSAGDKLFLCDNCKRFILTTDGYYFCAACQNETCTQCAPLLSVLYPTLSEDDIVAEVARLAAVEMAAAFVAQLQGDKAEKEEKPVISCVGSSSHEFKLLPQSPYDVYRKDFGCNVCWQDGDGELYHCDCCQFDAHRECAELPKQLKVFFHQHLLEFYAKDRCSGTEPCKICEKPVHANTDDFYACMPCRAFVHARCAKHPEKLMGDFHDHILNLVAPSPEKSILCDGCVMPLKGFRYTCARCDYDLHPVCVIFPPNPLCVFDGGHRLAIERGRRWFSCARCRKVGCSWLYHCEICEVDLHLKCVNEVEDKDEESEDEEDLEEVWNKLYEAALNEYVSTDYAAKVNLLSELVEVFMKTEAQAESLDSRSNNQREPSPSASSQQQQKQQQQQQQRQQQPAPTPTVKAKINTRVQCETHVVNEMFGKMHVHDNAQTSEEAERKAKKVAAKEAKQRAMAKSKADQDAKIENMYKLLQELHNDRGKSLRTNSMSRRDDLLKTKMDTIEANLGKLHEKTDKIHDVSLQIKTTQVHSEQRCVPRILLCSERGVNMRRRLITKLPVGIKAVQLHLLCEEPGRQHVVEDATGCEINEKIGERWEKLQPLLATGLQVVGMAVNVGTTVAGLGRIFPNLGRSLWDVQPVDLREHVVQGRNVGDEQAVADALRVSGAEDSAAQWLVTYLRENQVIIWDAFGLLRVRYLQNCPPHYRSGSLAWLCSDHRNQGLKSGILESYPTSR